MDVAVRSGRRRVIVFAGFGSYGDLNPLLAIARFLLPHCHVRFISNESFRKHIEASGVEFFGAGTPEEQHACNTIDFSPERLMQGLMLQFRMHVGRNVPRVTPLFEQWQREGDDLLLVTPLMINACYPVCEKLKIPVVQVPYAPSFVPLNREDFVLTEVFSGCAPWKARWWYYPQHAWRIRVHGPPNAWNEWNAMRAGVGIGPAYPPYKEWLRRVTGRRPLRLNIVARILMAPRWFAEPMGWGMKGIRCVGFPLLDQSDQHRPGSAVEAFIERHGAPVVFAPGTGVQAIDEFCAPIEEACRQLKSPGILLAKHGKEAFERLNLRGDHPIMHVPYVDDLAWLMQRSRLLIHSGGIGTIAQAIRAGVVQIIHPLANDQPRNAIRVVMNGLGGALYGEAYTPEDIAATCRHLETSETHIECRRHYAQLMHEGDGAREAAAMIDALSVKHARRARVALAS
jgi:rhamnosyltransferase subunit B